MRCRRGGRSGDAGGGEIEKRKNGCGERLGSGGRRPSCLGRAPDTPSVRMPFMWDTVLMRLGGQTGPPEARGSGGRADPTLPSWVGWGGGDSGCPTPPAPPQPPSDPRKSRGSMCRMFSDASEECRAAGKAVIEQKVDLPMATVPEQGSWNRFSSLLPRGTLAHPTCWCSIQVLYHPRRAGGLDWV